MKPFRPFWTALALAACSSTPPAGDGSAPAAAAVRFAPDTSRADLPEGVRRVCAGPAAVVQGVYRPSPGARPVTFRTVRKEEHTGLEVPLRCVVRTPEEWSAVARFGRLPPADLEGGTLVVAAMGTQPITNRYLTVDRVTARGDTVTVSVLTYDGAQGSDLGTTPATVVYLSARPAVVEFVETYDRGS